MKALDLPLTFPEPNSNDNSKENKKKFQDFRKNMIANVDCATQITEAIDKHYDGYRLDTRAVLIDVLSNHTPERVAYTLAVRIYGNNGFDKRFSESNEKWATELLSVVPALYKDKDNSEMRTRLNSFISTHNGLADMMISAFRADFPEVNLWCEPFPAYIEIKPIKSGFAREANSTRFETDYDESLDKAYLTIGLEYPSYAFAMAAFNRSEAPDFHPYKSAAELVYDVKDKLKNSAIPEYNKMYAIHIFEDGDLNMCLSGTKIPLTDNDKAIIRLDLNKYTQQQFKMSIEQTLHAAMNGKPIPSHFAKTDIGVKK